MNLNLAHVHLLLNHFPTIGMIVGLGLFLVAIVAKSDDLKRASLVNLFLHRPAVDSDVCHGHRRASWRWRKTPRSPRP